ncbi:MAG: UDP-N-acetylmuramate dehydrogenase [Lachnospiraceae bacterium]|nr:UDP-N-acetylmuramate dehydrogenase [Lachnospiraceae bacterium]
MIGENTLETLSGYVGKEHVHPGEPLAPRTSFRLGGPCDVLVEPQDEEQLARVMRYLNLATIPFFVLGNGSNTLVRDVGYEGVVVHIGPALGQIEVEGTRITAGAGAMLSQVAAAAARAGLSGLEFASGIPGSVGGAVVMNAGAYGGEMCQVVECVRVVSPEGELLEFDRDTMEFGYRKSILRARPYTACSVRMNLTPGDPEEIRGKMEELNRQRREKQPLEYPSAGSTFKRPEGYFAGKLIMDAGLRGFQIGGARVSDKHCGFLINAGNATAADVIDLMDEVRERVKRKFGVKLEPEIVIIGK